MHRTKKASCRLLNVNIARKLGEEIKNVPNPGVEPGSCRRHTAMQMRATYTNRCTN